MPSSSAWRWRARGRAHDDRGSAVVEFALLLPILLVMLLALMQVGVLARDRLLVAQAARAGAREAAITDSESDVREASLRAAPGLDATRFRLAITRSGERGSPVTVSIAYEVPVAAVLGGWLMPSTVTLDTAATARQEYG